MDPHPPSPRPKTNFTGCFVAIGILIILLIIGVIFIFGVFRFAKSEAHDQSQAARVKAGENHRVIIRESELNSYSAADINESLTPEHFVAVVIADDVTSLAKEMFADQANGLRIEWMLQVQDIRIDKGDAGDIEGNFVLPYQITRRHGSSGSSVRVTALFPAETANQLINLRKEQWVAVTGELRIDPKGKSVTLKNASLVTEAIEPASEAGATEVTSPIE